jgi:hypothetical protein
LYVALFALDKKLKGTVPQDFQLQVFFMNQFPPSPESTIWAVSIFFSKIYGDITAQGARGVANGKNLQSEKF